MKITLDVELQEGEANQISRELIVALQAVSDQVVTRVVTDKNALSQLLRENILRGGGEIALVELNRRFSQPHLFQDCLDVVYGILVGPDRVDSALPFVAALCRLPEPVKVRVRDEIVQRSMAFLSTPRRLDSSREPILPHADVVASFVKLEILPVKNVVLTLIQMIRLETTRCAGITCLGKLMEVAHEVVLERCDQNMMELLRAVLGSAQQDDTFIYDVEYIMEPLGWSQSQQNKFIQMGVIKFGAHHATPIVAMAYSGASATREVVVTSSADGTIATWDAPGKLIESCVLARHYASCLDIAKQGRALLVGGVGRQINTIPAVVFYAEEMGRWVEKGAVEPENSRVITCVKSLRNSGHGSLLFFCGVNGAANALCYYDATRQSVLREFHDHSDIITTIYTSSERENLLFSGSRDCTVVMYDMRMPQSTGQQFTHHYSTVTAIDGFGDYIVTGGLDKRIMVHDTRMMHAQNIVRDLDSAVLSLSVSPQFICATSTLTGIHFVNLSAGNLPICKPENTPTSSAIPSWREESPLYGSTP